MPEILQSSPVVRPAPLVVLVDDDDALRAALKFSLEIEGYTVIACDTGEALLALDLPADAGCLVVDYKLDALNGLDALEALRDRGVALPAIVITSFANPMLLSRAAQLDAEVVEKPLLGDALLSRIHELLPLS